MEEEIWVELIEEGSRGKYISNYGNVKCDVRLSFLKHISSDGYYIVNIPHTVVKMKRYRVL